MPTLREVITDIHANPAAYTTAFPVSEPEVEEYPHLNSPSEELGGSITVEMFDAAHRRLNDIGFASTPFTRDSIAQRVLDPNAYGRMPRGLQYVVHPDVPSGRVYMMSRADAERIFPPVDMPPIEISGDGSGALGYITALVREEDGRLVMPSVDIPSSEPAPEWEIPAGFELQPIEREPEPSAPSTDRFYLDADGELQFGPR